jgi:phosphoglycerate dehydrogenase-like enzyme
MAEGCPKIAVLDDYQGAALRMADWSRLDGRADVTVFHDHLADFEPLVARLAPFDALCVMRERTPMSRALIERLPRLKLIASTGPRNASIDLQAAADHGVGVVHTGYKSEPTVELTWALILAGARHLVAESASVRGGGWQVGVGDDMSGATLGLLGLGNVGARVAKVGLAFGMKVIAWSQNLTDEKAAAQGATRVSKGAAAGRPPLSFVAEAAGDAAHRLRLARPLPHLLWRHGRAAAQVARCGRRSADGLDLTTDTAASEITDRTAT